MLVGTNTRRVEIPHEPGEWLELRQLTWRQLKAAKAARQMEVLQSVRTLGGDLLRDLQQMSQGAAAGDPTAEYDQATVLSAGIAAWSYAEAVSPEAIDQLDPATADWALRELVVLTPQGEEAKNG